MLTVPHCETGQRSIVYALLHQQVRCGCSALLSPLNSASGILALNREKPRSGGLASLRGTTSLHVQRIEISEPRQIWEVRHLVLHSGLGILVSASQTLPLYEFVPC